jgi:predicted metalloprotease
MRISIFVDELRETIVENGKEKQVEKEVLTVSGCKLLAMSENVFIDGKKLIMDKGDWLEIDVMAVKLINKIEHENAKNLYETIYIYTLPHLVAEEIAEQLAEKFGKEKEEEVA